MRVAIHREWLQKHPTPRAGDGDFHWYPGAVDPELLSTIAAETAGELTIWLAPGRVVCARRFAGVAPADGRRYTGIAATIAEAPGASAAALLAATPLPEPAPWTAPLAAAEGSLPDDVRVLSQPPHTLALGDDLAAPLATRLRTLTTDLDRLSVAARRATTDQRRTSPVLLGALAVALLTNVLLAALLFTSRPAPDRGAVDDTAPVAAVRIPDAGVPDAGVPDAAVDAAPVVEAAEKAKPAPPRRKRK